MNKLKAQGELPELLNDELQWQIKQVIAFIAEQGSTDAKRGKVLIVDDDPLNRLVLEKTLQQDYDVFCVESGEKALTFLKACPLILLILDIVMPVLMGMRY